MSNVFAKTLGEFLVSNEVAKHIESYLEPGRYTGAMFEKLADTDHPDQYTEKDFAAVSMLSVTVPYPARRWLLDTGADYASELLCEIDPGAHIADPDVDGQHHLSRGNAAWELWHLLNTAKGLGPTTISKLMAVKRPHLVPIHDSVVSGALGIQIEGSWELWRTYMVEHSDDFEAVRAAANEAGGEHLSDLRVIDIAVWMEARRQTPSPDHGGTARKARFTEPDANAVLAKHRRRSINDAPRDS